MPRKSKKIEPPYVAKLFPRTQIEVWEEFFRAIGRVATGAMQALRDQALPVYEELSSKRGRMAADGGALDPVVWGWAMSVNLINREVADSILRDHATQEDFKRSLRYEWIRAFAIAALRCWSDNPDARTRPELPSHGHLLNDAERTHLHQLVSTLSVQSVRPERALQRGDYVFQSARWDPRYEARSAAESRIRREFEQYLHAQMDADAQILSGRPPDADHESQDPRQYELLTDDQLKSAQTSESVRQEPPPRAFTTKNQLDHFDWLALKQVNKYSYESIANMKPYGTDKATVIEGIKSTAKLVMGPEAATWLHKGRPGPRKTAKRK